MAFLCCCDLWRAWLLLGWPTESSPSLQIFLPLKFRLHALYIFKSQGHIVLQDWYLKDRNVLNAIKPKRRLSNVYWYWDRWCAWLLLRLATKTFLLHTLLPLEICLLLGPKKYPRWKVDCKRTEMFLHFEKA